MRQMLSAILLALFAIAAPAFAQERHALIIANRGYSEAVGPLANTHEDADIVAAALREAGFSVVVETEQSRVATLAALRAHARRVASGGPGAVGLFYYAGHGAADLESARNYLIPVDVDDASTLALWDASIPLPEIQRRLTRSAPGAHHFIVFDACRNELELAERDIAARGFVPEISQGGVFVAFSTAPQRPASDGNASEVGGPYANAFAAEVRRAAGRDAVQFFEEVRYAVRDRTGRQQLPWSVNGLGERVYLFGRADADDEEETTDIAATTPAASSDQIVFNTLATPCEYATFARDFADSPLAFTARVRAGSTPPCDEAPAEGDDAATDTAAADEAAARADMVREAQRLLAEMGYEPGPADGQPGSRTLAAVRAFRAALDLSPGETIDEDLLTDLRSAQRLNHRAPAPSVTEVATSPPAASGGARAAGSVFRDSLRSGGEGPEMVVVPAGSFTMGSPSNEAGRGSDEGPQRTVSIPRAFAVGRYEVTWDDWAACVRGGGCASNPNPSDQGWGRGRRPVINVSWNDAQEYVRWLSSQTGETYRLLSEAEWEYAARAGSTGRYAWGDQEPTCSTSAANGANYSACSDNRTHAVGSYRANRFGLHDMHGNVWEWVEDCYADSYSGAPTNGSARTSGDCSRRVLRGGSWVVNPQLLRSANRIRNAPSNRYVVSGFRLARTVSGP